MLSKRNKGKRKGDRCKFCGGKIRLVPGTSSTWIHEDKKKDTHPFPHAAMPWSQVDT